VFYTTVVQMQVFYRIVIIEGRNLIPADNLSKGEPTSDPYVVFRLCDSKGNRIGKIGGKTQVGVPNTYHLLFNVYSSHISPYCCEVMNTCPLL
jgi:hypothetical protein